MALTWTDVINVAPELAATPAGTQAALLGYAVLTVNRSIWGAYADQGTVYLAAHLATLARMRGAGAVTQESVGQLARTYLMLTPKRGYDLTAYGAMYWQTMKLVTPGVAVF